ncbi:MAG: ABC transporter permease [Clostridia bacterium]|nr:ABC transporter permease [Clostridia bacterium]
MEQLSYIEKEIANVDLSKLPKKDRGENIRKSWYKFKNSRGAVAGLVIILLIAFVGIFYKYLAPHPDHVGAYVDFANSVVKPSAEFPLGTDKAGRCVLSRLMFSCRGAFTIGLGVICIVVPLGSILGLIAGYWNKSFIATVILRLCDIFLSLPSMLLILCVATILEPSLTNAMLAMCVCWWPTYARLVYGSVVSAKNEVYVKSAELIGASNGHILIKEILPNCFGPIFTRATFDMGVAILSGATLSYLGMGEQAPTPSLGSMVNDGLAYLPDFWWLAIAPAVVIMLIVLAFNLAGDGVKNMLSSVE